MPLQRNDLFVELLLTQSLGIDHYQAIKNELIICSGKKNNNFSDLIDNTQDEFKIQREQYGLGYGNQKKSLEKVVGQGGNLDDTVLIDDDPSWVTHGQERNYLYVPGIYTHNYYQDRYSESYNEQEGQWRIPFKDLTGCNNNWQLDTVFGQGI